MAATWTAEGQKQFDRHDLERLAQRLERTARPCGCKSGAALTLAALAGWPMHVAATSGLPRTPLAAGLAVATYAVVVLMAAVSGKLAGIVVGRHRHRRLEHRLARLRSVPKAA